MITFKHIRAILALPFMVLIVIPSILLYYSDFVIFSYQLSVFLEVVFKITGGLFLLLGLVFLIGNIVTFAKIGNGTLAPWDPPTKLVVTGMYRYVRNPMITGVMFILIAESLLTLSLYISCWAVLFIFGSVVLIPIIEEPQLEKRFGDDYRLYKRHVPRWIPRWTAWEQNIK